MRLRFAAIVIIAFWAFLGCTTDQTQDQFTLYFGGDILTMAGDTPNYAEALLVQDDRIAFVGSKDKAIEMAGNQYTTVDLKGQTLIPGLIDGHSHFAAFPVQAIGAQILPPPDATAANIPTLIQILKDWNTSENLALTGWIFGIGFDDSVLEEKRFPTRHDLDEVSTEHPVMIIHISGHFASVNSKALEMLNITAETPDPEGGLIRREENNEPNGVLEELAAIPYFEKAITPLTPEAADKFLDKGQEMALSYGYTTAQEGRAFANHEQLVADALAGKLKIDVVSYIDHAIADRYMDSKWNSKTYKGHYRIGGVKLTLDGSPQGRTAWRTKPYLIPPYGQPKDYKGYPAIPNDEDVTAIYESAFKNGHQILTHANGDAAMDQMIRTMKKAQEKYGHEGRRDVLVHGQYVRFDQLDQFAEMHVIASLFPLHTYYWGDWHIQLIGKELGVNISPTRTALNKGLKLTIHTDAPVALPNLMRMIGIAVERKSRSGVVLNADEALSPYEALQAITIWSAYQHFEEEQKGSLEVGKLADLVILDRNPVKVPHDQIKDILVMETIKEGISIYQRTQD